MKEIYPSGIKGGSALQSGMKRLLAAVLAMMMLFSVTALAQEDEELTEEDLFAQWDAEADETEDVLLEEGGEVSTTLTEEERAALEAADAAEQVTIDGSQLEINTNLPDTVFNVLLLGIDARQDVTDVGRSDAMMICSIDTQNGTVKLTSIQRDLLVDIPTKKNPYKITNAYRWGGPQLSMATVNQNFQMNIDKFVTINFYGLAAIIDHLGGVDMELTKAEASRINYELKKEPLPFDTNPGREKVKAEAGVHHLDGMQAVTYARIRGIKGENDFNRSERQRKLLEVLLEQVMQDMTVDKMVDLITVAMPYVLTNMSASDMAMVGMQVLTSDIVQRAQQGEQLLEQMRLPMDETWKYTESGGSSVVAFRNSKRKQENVEALHTFLYGEYIPAN